MKIGALPAVAMEQYAANTARVRKSAAVPMGTDLVEISSAPRLFSEALKAAKEAPEVRMDRVTTVRAQVEAGTYRVDAAAVAARMLSGMTGL